MKELLLYIQTLKQIVDENYGKECVFYDEGEWYSREHSRHITPQELCDYVISILHSTDEEYLEEIIEKAWKYDELCK
ncbi:MAG: hypothetical protein LLF98_02720 [Clostridium sp.]|uniref:hypothetical protein n=1 Tax=Clostridium sp. TaxID=1506 RepID=UPI0025BD57D4|nr:hypothetical protein [Clostridium sp.]MCE5220197.1 hypothetical protein [Clostridium sp.]